MIKLTIQQLRLQFSSCLIISWWILTVLNPGCQLHAVAMTADSKTVTSECVL